MSVLNVVMPLQCITVLSPDPQCNMHPVFVAPLLKTRRSSKLLMYVTILKQIFSDLILQMCEQTRGV